MLTQQFNPAIDHKMLSSQSEVDCRAGLCYPMFIMENGKSDLSEITEKPTTTPPMELLTNIVLSIIGAVLVFVVLPLVCIGTIALYIKASNAPILRIMPHVGVLVVIVLASTVLGFIFNLKIFKIYPFLEIRVILFLVLLIAGATAMYGYKLVSPYLYHYIGELVTASSDQSLKRVGIVSVIVLGTAAFIIRLIWRSFYGLTEVAFACIVAWNQLPNLKLIDSIKTDSLSQYALPLVSASIYLIVRGLDNIHQGLPQNRERVKAAKSIMSSILIFLRLRKPKPIEHMEPVD